MAVGVFRIDPNQGTEKHSSGTGGFALFGESSLPIVRDLNSREGWEFYGLDAQTMAGVHIIPFRVREGDDASCLNLNRAQTPTVLGVRPEEMLERGAFTFAAVAKGFSISDGWNLLKAKLPVDEVPAVADQASIQWALGKKIGDTLTYLDERGRTFKVRLVGALANSVLQGSLILSEDNFVDHFPSQSGYRMFLIDAPSSSLTQISAALSRSLIDVGLELTPSKQRLAEFNAVQNTYLSTFQVLGGLGLLLGSVGLGVVVLRNVRARRGELAVLVAIGFRPRLLSWLVLSEHLALLLLGLVVGLLAALVAVLPVLVSPGNQIPYASLALTLGGVFASGALGTWLATLFALRGRLLEALQNN
jgi:ABC-type antimicrobial peptide transport system permease subunit